MTDITVDHVEWAVVGRLRKMLEEPPHDTFNVTQTYALFTTILCWVVQRIRVRPHEVHSQDDRLAHKLHKTFSNVQIANDPWRVHVVPISRIELIDAHPIMIPAPENFATHTVDRFLVNLRDATAHGDARNVSPFNFRVGSESLLGGFIFTCAEFKIEERKKRGREKSPS
jgi:hypothetical protein